MLVSRLNNKTVWRDNFFVRVRIKTKRGGFTNLFLSPNLSIVSGYSRASIKRSALRESAFERRRHLSHLRFALRNLFNFASHVSRFSSYCVVFFSFFLLATKQPSGRSSLVAGVEGLMAKLVVIRARGLKRPARTPLELGRARLNFHPTEVRRLVFFCLR